MHRHWAMSALASLAVHIGVVFAFASWAGGLFVPPEARLRLGAPAGDPDWGVEGTEVDSGGVTNLHSDAARESSESPRYEATRETLRDVGLLPESDALSNRPAGVQSTESQCLPTEVNEPVAIVDDAWLAFSQPMMRLTDELSRLSMQVQDSWGRVVRASRQPVAIQPAVVIEMESPASPSDEEPVEQGKSAGAGGSTGNDGVSHGPVALADNPAPRYPPECLRRGQEGAVSIALEVGVDGRVIWSEVSRSSGVAALDEAALIAVKGWRFSPEVQGGTPVACRINRQIEFRLSRPPR